MGKRPVPPEESKREQPFDRALKVLRALANASEPLSITDIATVCELPLPTAHRLVGQLVQRDLVKRYVGSKRFMVGSALLDLATSAIASSLRNDDVHRVLAKLAQDIDEHCHIGIRVDDEILYVDSVDAPLSTGLRFNQGGKAPLHCTSIGKLFLAEMSEKELDDWLNIASLKAFTNNTIVTKGAIRSTVKQIRREGWATSNEELASGVVGCAVQVRDKNSVLCAGLGISVPSARVSFDELGRFRRALESAAQSLEALMA